MSHRSDARDVVASLFAASRKNFFPAFSLHSRAKPVLLVPPPNMRLKRTLYQAIFSLRTKNLGAPRASARFKLSKRNN